MRGELLIFANTRKSNSSIIPSTCPTSSTRTITSAAMFNLTSSFSASNETLTSVTTTTSTGSLVKKPSSQTNEKDYFAALGALQSQYGFGGGAPTQVALPKPSKSTKSKSKPKSTKQDTACPNIPTASKEKDYEAAYGALSSSYGFGGAPVPSNKASWLSKK